MADFSALKTAIQANIRTNGNEEITGAILQDILLSVVTTMGDGAINSLAETLQAEITNRQNAVGGEAMTRAEADSQLSGRINAEAQTRGEADTQLGNSITAITTRLNEGYVYAGIATPSTNPGTPAGKVFYIALQAGTYTNFISLTVTQGITIFKYNGTAWSKEQLVAIDDVPTAGSNNLVKSGGVFPTFNAVNKSLIPITGNVSIIGDSISTFAGTMPSGYVYNYPDSALGVTSVYDMWWHLLLSLTNSKLEVNASYSGSRVTNGRAGEGYPDFYDRTNILGSPNYIFVELGTNDSGGQVALGDYDYDSENLSESEFIPAYIKGVKALKANYPNAKIVLFVFQMANSYANAIKNIGKHYELDVIDVRSYYVSNVHPNKLQMCSVAQTTSSFYIRGKCDDEPTAGSDNLVKSGGILNRLSKVFPIIAFKGIGTASNLVESNHITNLIPGHTYLLWIEDVNALTSFTTSSPSFEVWITDGTTPIKVADSLAGPTIVLKEYYIVTLPEDYNELYIKGRQPNDVVFNTYLQDVYVSDHIRGNNPLFVNSKQIFTDLITNKDGIYNRELDINGVIYPKYLFEIGGIDFNGPTYEISKYQVRTSEGLGIYLKNGDKLGLTDYSDAEFYLGYYDTNNIWHKIEGWKTSDYTIPNEGKYLIILQTLNAAHQTTPDTLASLVKITRNRYYNQSYDETPTIGHTTKEVSSDGIALQFIKGNRKYEDTIFNLNISAGLLYSSNGTIMPSSNEAYKVCEEYLPVYEGEVIHYVGIAGGASKGLCCYDINKSYLSSYGTIGVNNANGTDYTIPVGSGVRFIRVCTEKYTTYGLSCIAKKESEDPNISALRTELNNKIEVVMNPAILEKLLEFENYNFDINENNIVDGYYLSTSGALVSLGTAKYCSTYFPVISGKTLRAKVSGGGTAAAIVWYNKNFEVVGYEYGHGIIDYQTFTVPINAVYCRLSTENYTNTNGLDGLLISDERKLSDSFVDLTKLLVVAHQANCGIGRAPANSVHAVYNAAAAGVMAVECDVRFTSDGVAVIMHGYINETMVNADGTELSDDVSVESLTWLQLSTLYKYRSSNAKYQTRVCTFDEWLDAVKETKLIPFIHGLRDMTEMQKVLNRFGDEFIWMGSHDNALKNIRDIAPKAILIKDVDSISSVSDSINSLKLIGGICGLSSMTPDIFTDELLTAMYANGFIWQDSISFQYPKSISRGCNFILTDNWCNDRITYRTIYRMADDLSNITHDSVVDGCPVYNAADVVTINVPNITGTCLKMMINIKGSLTANLGNYAYSIGNTNKFTNYEIGRNIAADSATVTLTMIEETTIRDIVILGM